MGENESFIIRKGLRKDAAAAARLWMLSTTEHALYDPIYTPVPHAERMMRRFLSDLAQGDQTCFFVAEAGDKVVGFVTGELRSGTPLFVPRTWASLEDIYVEQGWRDRGVGRGLVERCAEWASALGADGISLQVATANQHAKRFYKNLGFREVSIYEVLEFEKRRL